MPDEATWCWQQWWRRWGQGAFPESARSFGRCVKRHMVLTPFEPHINPMRPSTKVGNRAWGEAAGKHLCLRIIPGAPGEKERKAWVMPFGELGKGRGRSSIWKERCLCASFSSRGCAEGRWNRAEKWVVYLVFQIQRELRQRLTLGESQSSGRPQQRWVWTHERRTELGSSRHGDPRWVPRSPVVPLSSDRPVGRHWLPFHVSTSRGVCGFYPSSQFHFYLHTEGFDKQFQHIASPPGLCQQERRGKRVVRSPVQGWHVNTQAPFPCPSGCSYFFKSTLKSQTTLKSQRHLECYPTKNTIFLIFTELFTWVLSRWQWWGTRVTRKRYESNFEASGYSQNA